jgi:hypothetical protein
VVLIYHKASDYSTQAILYWESEEQAVRANKEDSAEIFADVKNYTDVHPVIFGGTVVGSG